MKQKIRWEINRCPKAGIDAVSLEFNYLYEDEDGGIEGEEDYLDPEYTLDSEVGKFEFLEDFYSELFKDLRRNKSFT